MRETAAEIRELQQLLDRSAEQAGPHLRSIFTADCAMSAEELASLFRGPRQIAVATVTAGGEPRVSPVDALLIHGRFWFGTHESAARIRHLRKRPGISLTYFERDQLAVVVHGVAELVEFGEPGFEAVDSDFIAVYGGSPSTAGEGSVFVCVHPRAIHTFVRRPAGASG